MRKAVVWLCQEVHKPILKLTQKDYLEHSLGELLDRRGPYDKINIDVFNALQHTITGWPGGKPDADDSQRPVSAKPYPKKVLIFSPHPDDDVISMGGTFIRLVHQGHDVHVAYETSGDLAVHDDVVLQHMDAAHQLGFADEFDRIKAIIDSKVPGEPEPKELLAIKGAIRRSEARGADRSFGLNDNTNVHFLDLPFYESGGVKKMPRTQADLDIIKDLLKRLRPDQVFMSCRSRCWRSAKQSSAIFPRRSSFLSLEMSLASSGRGRRTVPRIPPASTTSSEWPSTRPWRYS